MAANQDTLYVKGNRNVEVKKREVTLGDLLTMECSNQAVVTRLKTLKVWKIPEGKEQRYVIEPEVDLLYPSGISKAGSTESWRNGSDRNAGRARDSFPMGACGENNTGDSDHIFWCGFCYCNSRQAIMMWTQENYSHPFIIGLQEKRVQGLRFWKFLILLGSHLEF